ncbi:hypothetical protein TVAG_116080 [Trichomonas vaginalis G3]|uniref:Uncharacterized protein n=1 Tax=Trichomonas vaginalis (strain ATCC PRA-98 / G3) TaxID=412133 RepID=A2EXP4_TRIV3|nr:hypothetical protein TVAGG3_0222550 [Trichomonas vaginalis G3]EAY02554.1 hypothetical protein TVAG_116080 [Trichomonas vaginalis G3]KAI5552055.1 hypothetical protein TVAGG3_0222550 [Trichomonas vaginalis G3]|eukprot:XP_001314793.1 hypothetical protein [Trichomonas vaginalis G3]
MTKVFQSLFECGEPFPTSSKLFKENNVLTLTNDAIIKHKNFFDILYLKASSSMMADNFTKLANITESFPEVNSWILLSKYEELATDKPHFEALSSQYGNNEMCNSIFERFTNDAQLINQLTLNLGIKISTDDLANKSIPHFLMPIISTIETEVLDSFMQNKLFVLADNDRERDISILYAYRCYESVLDKFDPVKLNEYLSKIRDPEVIRCLTVDLFSLLFLPQLDFSLEDAKLLITAIMPFASSQEYDAISRGLSRLMFGQHLGFTKFKECLYSQEEALVKCLSQKMFELCEKTVQGNAKLVELCQAAQALDVLRTNSTVSLKIPNKTFELEKNFSYMVTSPSFKSDIPGLNKIFESRKNKTPLQILAPVDTTQNINDLMKLIQNAMEDYTLIDQIPVNYNLLHQYLSMEAMLHQKNYKSPAQIIQELKNSTEISKILGPNSIERILATKNSIDLLPIMEKEYPLVAQCIKLINNPRKISENEVEILNSLQSEICEEDFVKEVKEALNNNDIDKLIDLRLKNTKIFDSLTVDVKLSDFIQIYPEKSSLNVVKVAELGIEKKDTKGIIDELLNKQEFLLGKRFAKEFYELDYFIEKMTLFIQKDPFCLKKYGEFSVEILNLLPSDVCTKTVKNATFDLDIENTSIESLAQKLNLVDIDEDLYDKIKEEIEKDKLNLTEKVELNKFKFKEVIVDVLSIEKSLERINLFKKKQNITKLFCELLLNDVSKLEFDSVESENEVIKIMTKISRILNKIKSEVSKSELFLYETECSQVNSLTKLFRENILFGRYSIPVDLSYFNSLAFVDDLSLKCCLKDVDIVDEIKGPWKFSSSIALLSKAIISFLMGDDKLSRDSIQREKILGGHLKPLGLQMAVRDLSYPYLYFLTRTQNSDPYLSMLLGSNTQLLVSCKDKKVKCKMPNGNQIHGVAVRSIHERVRAILDGLDFSLQLNEQAIFLNDIIKVFFGPIEYSTFCSSCGMFESSITSYNEIPSSQKGLQMTMRTIFVPAIANLQWKKLLRYVDELSKVINVEQVADFFWQKGMEDLSLSLLIKLKKYEKALNYKMQILPTRESWSKKLEDLKFIVDTVVSEIHERSNKKQSNEEDSDKSMTNSQLMKMSSVAGIEHQFIQMCIDENIPFKNLDLIGGKRSDALLMCILSLINGRFNVCVGISDCYQGLMEDACDSAVDRISDFGRHPEKIPQFLEFLYNRADNKTYHRIAKAFVLKVASRAADLQTMVKFIKTHVKTVSLQVELLLKLNFAGEALRIAEKDDNLDIAKVIEYAEQNGEEMLLNAAQRIRRRN